MTTINTTAASIEAVDFHGLPCLRLRSAGGASAIVSLFGAQVLSWCPPHGRERLFLSERAIFDGKTPIRGGVPICFPQFSTLGSLPRHGIARTAHWQLDSQRIEGRTAMLCLKLPAPALAGLWPESVAVDFTIVLDDARLDMELGVENDSDTPLAFTAALHSYLAVDDSEDVEISGLRGRPYRNAAADNSQATETSNVLVLRGEMDRVYREVAGPLMLRDSSRAIGIHAENFADVVVWNPGPERCATITDMPPDAWRRMVCIEAGAIDTPAAVAAGEGWWARQTLVDLGSAG